MNLEFVHCSLELIRASFILLGLWLAIRKYVGQNLLIFSGSLVGKFNICSFLLFLRGLV